MLLPGKRPGDQEWTISYSKPGQFGTVKVFAKTEEEARKVFKKYVGNHKIHNVKRA